MLRWLYYLRKPVILFCMMIMIGVSIAMILTTLLGTGRFVMPYDMSSWSAVQMISLVTALLPMTVFEADAESGYEKYSAVMPVSRRKYITSAFIYFGTLTIILSLFASVSPILATIIGGVFEWKYALLGVSLCLSGNLILIFIIISIMLSVNRIFRIIGVIITFTFVFLFVYPGVVTGDMIAVVMEKFLNMIIAGSEGLNLISILSLTVTAAVGLVAWEISCALYKRRSF